MVVVVVVAAVGRGACCKYYRNHFVNAAVKSSFGRHGEVEWGEGRDTHLSFSCLPAVQLQWKRNGRGSATSLTRARMKARLR